MALIISADEGIPEMNSTSSPDLKNYINQTLDCDWNPELIKWILELAFEFKGPFDGVVDEALEAFGRL